MRVTNLKNLSSFDLIITSIIQSDNKSMSVRVNRNSHRGSRHRYTMVAVSIFRHRYTASNKKTQGKGAEKGELNTES